VLAQDVISGSGANTVTGWDSLVGANDVVQGLSGVNYTKWNSRGVTARGTAVGSITFASGSFAAQGITDMRIACDNASEGFRMPNVIITTYAVRQFYEGSLVPQERYAAPASTGDASFSSLLFRGAPVLADPFATSQTMTFLNTDVIYVKTLDGADFEFQGWKDALDQEARTSELVFKGQVCVEDRRLINQLTTITA
jgi:hypothetical protein